MVSPPPRASGIEAVGLHAGGRDVLLPSCSAADELRMTGSDDETAGRVGDLGYELALPRGHAECLHLWPGAERPAMGGIGRKAHANGRGNGDRFEHRGGYLHLSEFTHRGDVGARVLLPRLTA